MIDASLDSLDVAADDREVVVAKAFDYLRRLVKNNGPAFDVLYFDPPYASDYEEILELIGGNASDVATTDGIVIVEHHKKKVLPDGFNAMTRYRELKQGDSVLSFYRVA